MTGAPFVDEFWQLLREPAGRSARSNLSATRLHSGYAGRSAASTVAACVASVAMKFAGAMFQPPIR